MNLIYSREARERLRILAPEVKKGVRELLEQLPKNPYLGKPLQRELTGFWSLAFKRYRLIYRLDSDARGIQIYSVGRRERIYQDFVRDLSHHKNVRESKVLK